MGGEPDRGRQRYGARGDGANPRTNKGTDGGRRDGQLGGTESAAHDDESTVYSMFFNADSTSFTFELAVMCSGGV